METTQNLLKVIPISPEREQTEQLRPKVKGRFIFIGEEKFLIKGVTYGTFQPDEEGNQFGDPEMVARDFSLMALSDINSVRVYTVPPVWLLDIAHLHGLRVMVGLPWEQHITFLDDPKLKTEIIDRVRKYVRSIAGHPAILCFTIGNEIPSGMVRWYGRKRVKQFLKKMYLTVKEEDPAALVSYVNYPPTEYLQLPFLDFFCFNVYLESPDRLEAYLLRLHNLAGERPLVMAEIGLDSLRNGKEKQAEVLDWQVRTTLRSGAAGLFIFSWTDEWYRGGNEIEDWDFGLTTRSRAPKPSLKTIQKAFGEELLDLEEDWPAISVAVCTLNGGATLRECLDGLINLNYPNFEIIVVSDGSTDDTEEIAKEYDCRLISTPNRGLSSARNTAWEAATGEIVVYIDDDAYPDEDWLTFLAISFKETEFAAIGGPNIPPLDDEEIAFCVANSPGGPSHVLFSDQVAEHIPGCNMAFRKNVLEAIGGFDPTFRAAGDDVDICWRIQEQGWQIGFNAAAVVWHHRRNTISGYWRQQKGYGKAEALLEEKWPKMFNAHGHVSWGGRIYTAGISHHLFFPRWQVYHGVWGTGFFQSLYERSPWRISFIPQLPEWYLFLGSFFVIGMLGFIWSQLFWFFLIAGLGLTLTIFQAIHSVFHCNPNFSIPNRRPRQLRLQLITIWLHLSQPAVRLSGRLNLGLTLWRRRNKQKLALPKVRHIELWSEQWKSTEQWLEKLEKSCLAQGVLVRRGDATDRWDLEIREGLTTPTRVLTVIEEHGNGKQMVKFRIWPAYKMKNIIFIGVLALLSSLAAVEQNWIIALLFGTFAILSSLYLLKYSLPLLESSLEEFQEIDQNITN